MIFSFLVGPPSLLNILILRIQRFSIKPLIWMSYKVNNWFYSH